MKALKFEERLQRILYDYREGFYSDDEMNIIIENLASSGRKDDILLKNELVVALNTFKR